MSERDPLSEASPLAADPDDAQARRAAGRPRAPARQSQPMANSLVLGVLIVGLVIAGWFTASQHQQLAVATDALNKSEHRLAALEERLQVTDQTMSDADKEVANKLGVSLDEVRKLWDATKKNRADAQAKAQEQGAKLSEIDAALKELKTTVGKHDAALAQTATLADQVAATDAQLRQLTSQLRQATDQLNATRQTVAGLESGLTRRVAETEKAVQAIDAYRAQLNSRLVDLQTRLDSVSPQPHERAQ